MEKLSFSCQLWGHASNLWPGQIFLSCKQCNQEISHSRTERPMSSSASTTATSQFNPISKWKEPVEIPLLTLFDVHRKPRQVNDDPNARVRMPLKVLSAEFHCPVCLGYMKKNFNSHGVPASFLWRMHPEMSPIREEGVPQLSDTHSLST